jgi:hypothetical protein
VENFKKAAENGQDATLTLTGVELTALLRSDEDFKERVAVTVEGDKLKGQVSLPFDFSRRHRRPLGVPGSTLANRTQPACLGPRHD